MKTQKIMKSVKKKNKKSKLPKKKTKNKSASVKKAKKKADIKKKPKKEVENKVKIRKKEIVKQVISAEDKKIMLELFSDAYARQVMIALGGENALEIIRCYPLEVSDDEIARKLKVKISDIRSTLNKMHGEGFVEYTRKKDNETGWYSYSWSLNKKNIVEWSAKINKEKRDLLESDVEKYYCRKCGLDSLVEFVDALKSEFKCSCCNGSLDFLEKDRIDQLFGKMVPEQMKRRIS